MRITVEFDNDGCRSSLQAKYLVSVKFIGASGRYDSTGYTYFSDDATIQEGDLVVVNAAGQIKLAKVANIKEFSGQASLANKWIIQKVDMAAEEARLTKIRRFNELQNQLTQETAKTRREIEMQDLIKANPRIADLLAQMRELG